MMFAEDEFAIIPINQQNNGWHTWMTPPPLLPFFNARKSSGRPMALPDDGHFLICERWLKWYKFGIMYLPSQSSTMVSSSVHTGLAACTKKSITIYMSICVQVKALHTHENPMHPIPSPSISPNIDGNELPAGKYAWNLGCCQCVTPGIIFDSTSCMMAGHSSGSCGASSGRRWRKYPGSTLGVTRRSPNVSKYWQMYSTISVPRTRNSLVSMASE